MCPCSKNDLLGFFQSEFNFSVIFGAITVIVYASAVKMPSPESALDASFYVAIIAIILNLVGVIVHGAGAKRSE